MYGYRNSVPGKSAHFCEAKVRTQTFALAKGALLLHQKVAFGSRKFGAERVEKGLLLRESWPIGRILT